jgi:hypothetical protein
MSGIYNLPENPSAADIIERSIIAHPSLFRDTLIKQAKQHDDYSRLTSNPVARRWKTGKLVSLLPGQRQSVGAAQHIARKIIRARFWMVTA